VEQGMTVVVHSDRNSMILSMVPKEVSDEMSEELDAAFLDAIDDRNNGQLTSAKELLSDLINGGTAKKV
jgi:hypothetical protein